MNRLESLVREVRALAPPSWESLRQRAPRRRTAGWPPRRLGVALLLLGAALLFWTAFREGAAVVPWQASAFPTPSPISLEEDVWVQASPYDGRFETDAGPFLLDDATFIAERVHGGLAVRFTLLGGSGVFAGSPPAEIERGSPRLFEVEGGAAPLVRALVLREPEEPNPVGVVSSRPSEGNEARTLHLRAVSRGSAAGILVDAPLRVLYRVPASETRHELFVRTNAGGDAEALLPPSAFDIEVHEALPSGSAWVARPVPISDLAGRSPLLPAHVRFFVRRPLVAQVRGVDPTAAVGCGVLHVQEALAGRPIDFSAVNQQVPVDESGQALIPEELFQFVLRAESEGRISRTVLLRSGDVDRIELSIDQPVELRGRVVGPRGAPVQGGRVQWLHAIGWGGVQDRGTQAEEIQEVEIGEDGRLRAARIASQTVGGPTSIAVVVDVPGRPVLRRDILVPADVRYLEWEFVLEEPRILGGCLRSAEGHPMAGLTIVAVRRGDELGRATTGIDGEFAVGALPSGSLDLEIRDAAGFLLETRRGVFAGMEPQEFRMWPQGDLVGTVVGLGGASVPGALISVVRDLDVEPTDVAPIHRTVKSDAQGAFSIQDLPSGTYTVLVPGGERTTAVVGGDPVEVHAPAAAAR